VATILPQPSETLVPLLQRAFGLSSFRVNQEVVCRAAIQGRDVLLVMPTGAGKSLCFQLPGIARGGTTLVISPLIALMEDQAAKLDSLGLSVARIHSGLDRALSRQACADYLAGVLQFLFIAPERLRVPGFIEMLAKRKPSLIAIDEAHCISQWGHDFRPDYRMLGQFVSALRPTPVIALTATATPRVQDDIAAQLGMADASRFIYGFRRENLGIEVVEMSPSLRPAFVADLLDDPARRPAIVYAPTRKQAEALAEQLSSRFPSAAYHAGLDARRRETVQQEFQQGRLHAVVATVAFGMGIDKADVRTIVHTSLPGTLEAYYQEIGRAGRDGLPSRAILLYSYADRKMHEFFFERDYPPVDELDRVYRRLGNEPLEKESLRAKLRMESDLFDRVLEKLVIHGGGAVDIDENAVRGRPLMARLLRRRVAAQKSATRPRDAVCRIQPVPHDLPDSPLRRFGGCTPSMWTLRRVRAPGLRCQTLSRAQRIRETNRLGGHAFVKEKFGRLHWKAPQRYVSAGTSLARRV